MVDYKTLYHIMIDGAENAIEAIDAQNYGAAKDILIRAEREAEEAYIEASGGEEQEGARREEKPPVLSS